MDSKVKRFQLERFEDVSGVSGTGIVADGVVFSNGKVVIHWLGETSSIVVWDSLDDAMKIHGHAGRTAIRWVD